MGQTARYGEIQVTIKWPPRDYPGLTAQTIPQSTNAIVLTVSSADKALGRVVAPRDSWRISNKPLTSPLLSD